MTTVVYRSGVLAVDSRCTDDKGYILNDSERKVCRLPDGSLFASCGRVDHGEALRLATIAKENINLDGDIEALLIRPNGDVLLYEGYLWMKQPKRFKYFAIGSGAPHALSAMDAGELVGVEISAITAAMVAIKRDPNSGGKVRYLKLKGKK